MDSVKQKRFSFAGFSSSLSRSLSFSSGEQKVQDESKNSKRSQKTKSLYVKSFRKTNEEKAPTNYDEKEANQSNGKEIRNSIRRSLSAVIYAAPQYKEKQGENDNKLVPVLVTSGLSESVGGILIDDSNLKKEKELEESKKKKSKPVEYDNTLDVFSGNDERETLALLWQGYCYTIKINENTPVVSELLNGEEKDLKALAESLKSRFQNDIWESYSGLIHPVHLFEDNGKKEQIVKNGRWNSLTVEELRRYYDNYGSMMLKIRESRMVEQQRHYHCQPNTKKEWIIPEIISDSQQITQQG
ncbi:hypothetical protein BY458DRAFT_518473 [Sporodiniella umbellata]|nr:hypothetical protein BY458DRAFT_518473 [Sporodiniella umbellata]